MTTTDPLQIAAWLAAVVGVPTALLTAVNAVRALRTQARASRLTAITGTNAQWQLVNEKAKKVTLSGSTLKAVERAYGELADTRVRSVLTGGSLETVTMTVPWVVAALLPVGRRDTANAPQTEVDYTNDLYARSLAFGFVRTLLANSHQSTWLRADERLSIMTEFDQLDEAMGTWVNLINEIAELYEHNLFDRLLFVRKRSVSIIQQLFVAEPYILWRNSTTPGRWGLRILGLGAEARAYHWQSHLQRAALRLRRNPSGFTPPDDYPGLAESAGWIISKGSIGDTRIQVKRSESKLRRQLGVGFSYNTKALQNELIRKLPIDESSGLEDQSEFDENHPKWSSIAEPDSKSKLVKALSGLQDRT